MTTFRRFEDIDAWQLARKICQRICEITSDGLFSKDFGLKDQINRSSGSIMDNIAEGFERDGNKEFRQFLSISKGSCGEVKSQLYRALDKHYISEETFKELYDELENVSGKLTRLMKYLSTSNNRGPKYD